MKVTTGSHYLAFVLDENTRNRVMMLYHQRHPVTVCHHVTIQLNIEESDVERLQSIVDANPEFKLSSMIETDVVDLFRVDVDGVLLATDQSFTHLTYTRKLEARNRDSNRVLKGEIDLTGIFSASAVLTGQFELIPY